MNSSYIPLLLVLVALPFLKADAPCASVEDLPESMIKAFEKSNAQFAKHLFRLARENHENENVFFSPASISLALGMLLEGARGNTRDEIKDQLVKDVDDNEISKAYSHFLNSLSNIGAQYELYSANKFYAQSNYKLSKEYVEALTHCFESDAKLVDFENKSEAVRNEVNKWVEKETKDQIKDLLSPGSVSEVTKFILINAVYFKSQWESPFLGKDGFVGSFSTHKKPYGEFVYFMMKSGVFNYFSDEKLQALELPYAGKENSMYIILPTKDKEFGMDDLEAFIDAMDDKMEETDVDMVIPRFNITQDFPLKELLRKMGMKKMFEENEADLSGMNGHEDLFVTNAFHKAFIQVSENGTEAAAASAVVVTNKLMAASGDRPWFNVDHPFFIFIKHKKTNSYLFAGFVAEIDEV